MESFFNFSAVVSGIVVIAIFLSEGFRKGVSPCCCIVVSGIFTGSVVRAELNPAANPTAEKLKKDSIKSLKQERIVLDIPTVVTESNPYCQWHPNILQEDIDGDGYSDYCDDDIDGDGFHNVSDNCVVIYNPSQEDSNNDGFGDLCSDGDHDGVPDSNDNCPDFPHPSQVDRDNDGLGDYCDDDIDGDGVLNVDDNCIQVSNPTQSNVDGDTVGDDCDDNPSIPAVGLAAGFNSALTTEPVKIPETTIQQQVAPFLISSDKMPVTAFPDVCKTRAIPNSVPIPYPNIAMGDSTKGTKGVKPEQKDPVYKESNPP